MCPSGDPCRDPSEGTGSGAWYVKSVRGACEDDKYTQGVTTTKKTRVYATDCTVRIVDVVVQMM